MRLVDEDEVVRYFKGFIDIYGFDPKDARFSIRDIEMNLLNVPTVGKWIPVSERLPEEKGEYLVTYHPCYWDDVKESVEVGIDSFMGKTSWAKRKYQRVIAWMPKIEPYEVEEE